MSISGRVGACDGEITLPVTEKPSYMIYYGAVDETVIISAARYDIAILHPKQGDLTREKVARIQSAGTAVLGYISVGEDLRTAGMTPEEMLADRRFTGDGSGPRVDPRADGESSLDGADIGGRPSPGGSGYAAYYLDDNDRDGRPDFNPSFGCAYTNIGHPEWYNVLCCMTLDGEDGVPGVREILSRDYGRGLGCDGLFLDTVDTCAPDDFTAEDQPGRTRFEWTAVGVAAFMERIRREYPGKLICQNRGLFFFNHLLEHYRYSPRASVDYLMFESYMLDSSPTSAYHTGYFADNRFNYAPKLAVEAGRSDGFTVLSLGYAEGPEELCLRDTLEGRSDRGMELLKRDIYESEELAGFSHYITDGRLAGLNDFVLLHREREDNRPPVWSSVYNSSEDWPPHEPEPRVGLGEARPVKGGAEVYWDVALDGTGTVYLLYYQESPFDFENDPELEKARRVFLTPEINPEYERGEEEAYPYRTVISGLESGREYYMVIRAVDTSVNHNRESNAVVRTVTPE